MLNRILLIIGVFIFLSSIAISHPNIVSADSCTDYNTQSSCEFKEGCVWTPAELPGTYYCSGTITFCPIGQTIDGKLYSMGSSCSGKSTSYQYRANPGQACCYVTNFCPLGQTIDGKKYSVASSCSGIGKTRSYDYRSNPGEECCYETLFCPLGQTIDGKRYSLAGPSCASVGKTRDNNYRANPGQECCYEVVNSVPQGPGDPSNTCQTEDNRDETFRCMDTACGGEWSTPETRTDPRWFSCSGGRICCKNQAKYNTNYGGGGQPPLQPDTGTTGGGTRPQTTITPVDGTPAVPQGPATGPCAKEKGGVKEYVDAFCNKEPFDAAKAQDGKFCTATYSDKYICNNPDPATGKPYEDYFEVTSGTSPCSQAPWCPSASTQPNPGPDANCTAYQGQTCRPGDFSDSRMCCQPNKNLECVDPAKNGIYTCQYIGGAAFTPTPGAAGNCDGANFGMWGAGCACPAGGGCGPGLGCYPEASGAVFPPSNPNGYFCASSRWCANSQTDVSGAAACAKADTYVSPTPTPQSKAYQADCPSNPPGQHVCAATCPTGYAQKPGNVGNQICSEFSSGTTPLCCVRQAVAANTPTPYATTPPTPTPTRVRQPLVPPSVPDCGADYQTWQSGTPCATATTCYDIYKNSSGASCYKMYSGQTCAHCAQ